MSAAAVLIPAGCVRVCVSPSDITGLVICWLAAWRITALLCYEQGPWDSITRLRRAAARFGPGRLLDCFHCTAVWVSAAAVAIVFPLDWISILYALSVAGAASITERWLGGSPPAAPNFVEDT
jgi:hypothetical protein